MATTAACTSSAKAPSPPAACARSPSRPCGRASSRSGPARAWATSAMPSRPSPRTHGFSVVREFCGHGVGRQFPRGAAGAALRPPGHAGRAGAGHDLHDRADDQRRPPRDQGRPQGQPATTTAGPSSRRTVRCRPSGSTPCSSPRPATRCSRCRPAARRLPAFVAAGHGKPIGRCAARPRRPQTERRLPRFPLVRP